MTNLSSRRGFLRVLGSAVALSSFGQAFGQSTASTLTLPKTSSKTDHTELLNWAATAEALSVTLYHQVLSGATFTVSPQARDQLAFILQSEQAHLDLLSGLGAAPLTRNFNLPADLCSDARSFVQTALKLEEVCTASYLAATQQLAALGLPELAGTAAQLGASEAQQAAALAYLSGLDARRVGQPQANKTPSLAAFIGQQQDGWQAHALPERRQVTLLVG